MNESAIAHVLQHDGQSLPTMTPSAVSKPARHPPAATPESHGTGVLVCFLILATLSRTPAMSFSLAPVFVMET